jgi:hypothetical protein
MVPQHQNSMHYFSFVVVVVQSEETENWGVESTVAESEILDLQLAFSAAHSADLGGN